MFKVCIVKYFFSIVFLLSMVSNAQENFYTVKGNSVSKQEFHDIAHSLEFVREDLNDQNALSFGFAQLATNLIPLLVDGASKLFYNPDNFNKEYFGEFSFFDPSGRFNALDPKSVLVFEQTGKDASGKQILLTQFKFDLGAVENVEGYHYLGLKAYELNYSWAKLSSSKNRVNYVLEIAFFYFDGQDRPQEFYLNPIVLNEASIPSSATISPINYQVIPKMKVLKNVRIHIREINAKKENWDNYLELYKSNQRNIANFLIKALPE
ncbi:hypothetical protein [Maribacter sp. MAR_2009_72]|uniref:hypothetical protein n=1 Tax=Maribacter sp. MAR_2009_72 TaxID=1250050 RepID=UPI001198EA90|nr:hypothetical protein [Maribacter sp. MAR_2009_72]TVZ16930.1 hypothetical protein JM81_3202 [Maribacter sp. MAR_2009_72]